MNLDLTFEHRCGYLWPISVFSLANIAKAAERALGAVTPVQLITIEQPGSSKPISPVVLDGRPQYLRTVQTDMARRKWQANQYELEAPFHPVFRLLTAPEGVLLALTVVEPPGKVPNAEMKLVRYQPCASPPAAKRP